MRDTDLSVSEINAIIDARITQISNTEALGAAKFYVEDNWDKMVFGTRGGRELTKAKRTAIAQVEEDVALGAITQDEADAIIAQINSIDISLIDEDNL